MKYTTTAVNSKELNLVLKCPNEKEYLDNQIFCINLGTEDKIEIGDKVPLDIPIEGNEVYRTWFNANYIEETKHRLIIREFEGNISSEYILPFIGIRKSDLLYNSSLVNCYVKHYDYKHNIGEYVYLIYRYIPAKYYSLFVEVMKKQSNCINYVKDRDKRFDCFIFKVDVQYTNDIKLLIKGKYSKISSKAKTCIKTFHTQTNPESYYAQVLHRGHILRNTLQDELDCIIPDENELEEMPKLIEEIWNYSKKV